MSRFAERSDLSELIDRPDIPFADWQVCLQELNSINTLLGGHALTVAGVKALSGTIREPLLIAEIGCGGGDNLKALHHHLGKQYDIHFIGIDLNQACVDFAQRQCDGIPATFICSDYRKVVFDRKPDILFNSLFCHHFKNTELITMLQWMQLNSRLGFFINDLQRHPLAFYAIRLLTRLFSRSYLVRHDGPVSVLRGFKKDEWQQLLGKAGISGYAIRWKWAFRYLVTVPANIQ